MSIKSREEIQGESVNSTSHFATLTGDSTCVNTRFDSPPDNPFVLLDHWFMEAVRVGVIEPKAMSLATIDAEHGFLPSIRMVAIKDLTSRGITFGTGENSTKGHDIKSHPHAAGNLYWRETLQQISFGGRIEHLLPQESDLIFNERTRQAKAVAAISQQSDVLKNEEELRCQIYQLIKSDMEIKRPAGWHGYLLLFKWAEFWIGSATRIHQRLRYDLINEKWQLKRLQP